MDPISMLLVAALGFIVFAFSRNTDHEVQRLREEPMYFGSFSGCGLQLLFVVLAILVVLLFANNEMGRL